MNAEAIVDILLEGDAEDFVSSLPKGTLSAYYEFSQHPLISDTFEVKRWTDGSYHYIGSIWQDKKRNLWSAYLIAPNTVVSHRVDRDTMEAAAADLWELYKKDHGSR